MTTAIWEGFRVGKSSYISCSYTFLYYIRNSFASKNIFIFKLIISYVMLYKLIFSYIFLINYSTVQL